MSKCDNTDCIMETLELKDAKVRIKALEGVMEAAKAYNEFMCGDKNDLEPSKREAQEVFLFGKLSLELAKLEEVLG